MAARHSKLQKRPKARITLEDKNVVGYDHEDQTIGQFAFMNALDTSNSDFFNSFLSQLAHAANVGSKVQERLSVIDHVIHGHVYANGAWSQACVPRLR